MFFIIESEPCAHVFNAFCRHDDVCDLVHHLDDALCGAIGVAFAAAVSIMCLMIYMATQVRN